MHLALFFVAVLGLSTGFPLGPWAGDPALGVDMANDVLDAYYGPWSPDYLRNRWWGAPYGRPGPYADPFDPLNPFADPFYGGFPKTMDVAKEKYVRDYPYGETEVGVRDSMTVRGPGGPWRSWNAPMPYRGYGPYGFYPPYGYDWPPYRRFPGMGPPRPSSLRSGGDMNYMRR